MKLIGLSLLILGAACAPEPSPEPMVTPEPKKVETPVPEPAASPTTAAGENPNRIHQLKDLKRTTLTANGKKIPAWIMDTESKRQEGMMFLTDKEVKNEEGMLFVFPEERPLSFWMQNTILPLDIIYIAKTGRVVSIAQGKPYDETSLPAKGDSQFVLELKQGGAKRFGIKEGTQVTIPKGIKANE